MRMIRFLASSLRASGLVVMVDDYSFGRFFDLCSNSSDSGKAERVSEVNLLPKVFSYKEEKK